MGHGESGALRERLDSPIGYQVISDHHTKPEDAGVVFSRMNPKLGVICHFVLPGTPAVPAVTENEVVGVRRKSYDRPLLVREDCAW